MQLPAGLERQEPRFRCDSGNPHAVIGIGGDYAGDRGAVPIQLELPGVGIDEVALRVDAPLQVRMVAGEAGVDERDAHAAAARHAVGLADVHAFVARLHRCVRIDLRAAHAVVLERLGERHTPVALEPHQHRRAGDSARQREHGTLEMQQTDGPGRDRLQVVVVFQGAHGAPCAVADQVAAAIAVAARGTARVDRRRVRIVGYGDHDEIGRVGARGERERVAGRGAGNGRGGAACEQEQ